MDETEVTVSGYAGSPDATKVATTGAWKLLPLTMTVPPFVPTTDGDAVVAVGHA